jgi:hypothetical protein
MEFEPISESTHEQLDLIEDLLKTSVISFEESEFISKTYNSLNYFECEKLIDFLRNKQVNRIHAGLNYNMGYLKQFMKQSI